MWCHQLHPFNGNHLKRQCYSNLWSFDAGENSSNIYVFFFFFLYNKTDLNKSPIWHVSAVVKCLQIIYQFHAFQKVSWHRWTYSRIEFGKMRLPAATNNEKKMNQGARVEKAHHLHRSIKPMRTATF